MNTNQLTTFIASRMLMLKYYIFFIFLKVGILNIYYIQLQRSPRKVTKYFIYSKSEMSILHYPKVKNATHIISSQSRSTFFYNF